MEEGQSVKVRDDVRQNRRMWSGRYGKIRRAGTLNYWLVEFEGKDTMATFHESELEEVGNENAEIGLRS